MFKLKIFHYLGHENRSKELEETKRNFSINLSKGKWAIAPTDFTNFQWCGFSWTHPQTQIPTWPILWIQQKYRPALKTAHGWEGKDFALCIAIGDFLNFLQDTILLGSSAQLSRTQKSSGLFCLNGDSCFSGQKLYFSCSSTNSITSLFKYNTYYRATPEMNKEKPILILPMKISRPSKFCNNKKSRRTTSFCGSFWFPCE